jgi:hypothetical protein
VLKVTPAALDGAERPDDEVPRLIYLVDKLQE